MTKGGDDRKGLPSSSEYPRIVKCPGYLNLKSKVVAVHDGNNPDATSGTRIHTAYALWEDEADYANQLASLKLSIEEETCLDLCLNQTAKVVKQLGFDQPGTIELREKRLWLPWPEMSGQFDRVWKQARRALMVDIKSGRDAVDPAEQNYQMRSYAIKIAQVLMTEGFDEIYVAVVQPWVSSTPTIARYELADIKAAYKEMVDAFNAARSPGASCVAGKHCKYCLVAHACEAGTSAVTESAALAKAVPSFVDVTPKQMEDLLEACEEAEHVIDCIRKEAKARLVNNPESVSGWAISKGRVTETITDPELVFGRVEKMGVDQKAFMGCVSIAKGKLEAAIKVALGVKGKALEQAMADALEGATTSKVSDGSLTRKKKGDDVQ